MDLFLHAFGRPSGRRWIRIDAGQQQRSKIAVGYCSCGAAYPSRLQRGGNREARRQRQRAKRERLRDERTVSRTLARSLSPFQGGSDPRNPETTGKLQILQKLNIPSAAKGNTNPSVKDSPMYVGMDSHTLRVEKDRNEKEKKEKASEMGTKMGKENKKVIRKFEDGLLD